MECTYIDMKGTFRDVQHVLDLPEPLIHWLHQLSVCYHSYGQDEHHGCQVPDGGRPHPIVQQVPGEKQSRNS